MNSFISKIKVVIVFAFFINLILTKEGNAQLIPDTLWRQEIGGDAMTRPLVKDEIVYLGTEKGTVFAFSATTGEKLWETSVNTGIFHQMETVGDQLFFVGSKERSSLLCLNKTDGSVRWRIDEKYVFDNHYACQMLLDETGLIFNSLDSSIVCLAPSKGEQLWSYKASGQVSPPVNYKNSIVFICDDGTIYKLSRKNGKLEEKINFCPARMVKMTLPPLVIEDVLIQKVSDTSLKAISLETKKTIWSAQTKSSFFFEFNTIVVLATKEGLIGLDFSTGEKKWKVPGNMNWYMFPTVYNNEFYYYARQYELLLIIDSEGKTKSTIRIRGKSFVTPLVTKDKIILPIRKKIFAIENK